MAFHIFYEFQQQQLVKLMNNKEDSSPEFGLLCLKEMVYIFTLNETYDVKENMSFLWCSFR